MDGKGKKGAILALLMGPKKPMSEGEESEDGEDSTAVVAAKAVLDAIDEKDPKMLADAMKTMVESCSGMGESESED